MTEDGRDWGERCVDMYKIVDKVNMKFSVFLSGFQQVKPKICHSVNLCTNQVGEGTYGEVYKATPPPEMLIENGELLALKKVTFEHCWSKSSNINF